MQAILTWAPLSEKSLAEYLAAEVHGTPSPPDTQIHSARTKLVHLHLPVLGDAGLIEWDTESSTVDTTAHPALTDARFMDLLGLESPGVDDVLDALSHEYRRIILTALWEGEAETTVTMAARKIAKAHDGDGRLEGDSIDDVAIALHHAHLPKLANFDLIEHDPETSRVTYTEHPTLEEVFTIIYGPDDYLVDKYDGLLSGLLDSYRTAKPDPSHPAEWPHHWRSHHG